jgi:hypothetical protein
VVLRRRLRCWRVRSTASCEQLIDGSPLNNTATQDVESAQLPELDELMHSALAHPIGRAVSGIDKPSGEEFDAFVMSNPTQSDNPKVPMQARANEMSLLRGSRRDAVRADNRRALTYY